MSEQELCSVENLWAVDRQQPPVSAEDYNYFINQLVECGRLSVHDAVRAYRRTEGERLKYPEIDIALCDHLNPGVGYQVRVVDGSNGETILYTNKNPNTGCELLTYEDCLEVAAMYKT